MRNRLLIRMLSMSLVIITLCILISSCRPKIDTEEIMDATRDYVNDIESLRARITTSMELGVNGFEDCVFDLDGELLYAANLLNGTSYVSLELDLPQILDDPLTISNRICLVGEELTNYVDLPFVGWIDIPFTADDLLGEANKGGFDSIVKNILCFAIDSVSSSEVTNEEYEGEDYYILRCHVDGEQFSNKVNTYFASSVTCGDFDLLFYLDEKNQEIALVRAELGDALKTDNGEGTWFVDDLEFTIEITDINEVEEVRVTTEMMHDYARRHEFVEDTREYFDYLSGNIQEMITYAMANPEVLEFDMGEFELFEQEEPQMIPNEFYYEGEFNNSEDDLFGNGDYFGEFDEYVDYEQFFTDIIDEYLQAYDAAVEQYG